MPILAENRRLDDITITSRCRSPKYLTQFLFSKQRTIGPYKKGCVAFRAAVATYQKRPKVEI